MATVIAASSANATYGEAMALTARVASVGAGESVSNGFVTFTILKGDIQTGTAMSGPVSGGVGTALFSLNGVPAGVYSIHASYEPEGTHFRASNTTTTAVMNVAKAGAKIVVTSSRNETNGEATFTANVSPETSGTPTGSVTFFKSGDGVPVATVTLATVNRQSVARFTMPKPPANLNAITAVYSGDANFKESGSAGNSAAGR